MRLHRIACFLALVVSAALSGTVSAQADEKEKSAAAVPAENDHASAPANSDIQVGDVLTVKLDELLPTQPVLAYDRIFASLGRYEARPAQLFDDLCLTNGGGGIQTWHEDSKPTDLDSYTCKQKSGSQQDALPTVLVAPDGKTLYLLSGHHILSTFWDMPNGGTSVPVLVKVTHSLAEGDIDEKWDAMKKAGQIWLYNTRGDKIKPSDLPQYLGMKQLKHDKYLSLVFFLRNVAYNDPDKDFPMANPLIRPMSVPYLQYHWAQYLRKHMKISQYDLDDPEQYTAALKEAASIIVSAPDDEEIPGSGKTAKALGKFEEMNTKVLDSLLSRQTSSWHYAMAYRIREQEESTPKRVLEARKAKEAEEKAKQDEATSAETKEENQTNESQ
ncbi:ParB/Srx family N-terminal domain-containing protein [Photobacterium sp. GJ3]|uniref:ParB/Srx family N-terminal domain-containing protein n=1 Tax=Photobacterium sp. GJ3 TaxID=2829502 RepID=UPI001B8BB577|nr:ParB/Srx family N-terminal domain-containing protein [Photobacterium sp. GJ3]QUJ68768.1 ParB/Srx family N-terminal domain-containing protein [Photobacterium sp. GJ3]